LTHAPSHYDLVLVGGPVWAFHPATPVRAYLQEEASRLTNIALLTHGGSAARQTLREMVVLGCYWLTINVLLDLVVLVLLMKMPLVLYLYDISLRYLLIPIISLSMGIVAVRQPP
jgi:hypothetical protein